MKSCALNLVNRQHDGMNEIRSNIGYFNQEAKVSSNNDRVCNLLKTTTYWLYDAETNVFGPSKFVSFKSMTFQCYEYWVTKGRNWKFDGTVARKANERTLGKNFAPDQNLSKRLLAWGEKLSNSDIFKGINQSKWRFIEIPKETPY